MDIEVSDAIIIVDNKVLLVQQRKPIHYGLWGFPGGKLEPGETPLQAAIRETIEEVGVKLVEPAYIKTYQFENSHKHVKQHLFKAKINDTITLKDDELMAYGWFSANAIELIKSNLRSPVIHSQAIGVLNGKL